MIETRKAAFKEDIKRISGLRYALSKFHDITDKNLATHILKRLRKSVQRNSIFRSLSSSLFSRRLRVREIRLLTSALKAYESDEIRFFHTVLKRWAIPADKLREFDPKAFTERLRFHLRQCGAASADGFLLARVHGEFEPYAKEVWPHFHGVGTGEMLKVLKNLKHYYSTHDVEGGPRTKVMLRKAVSLPEQISYIFQSFWPSRYRGPASDQPDETIRQRQKTRIPEPYHSEWVIWIHELKPYDLLIIIGNNDLVYKFKSLYSKHHKI